MPNGIDIHENHIQSLSPEVLELLLADRTTGGCILWATHDYEALGAGYGYRAEIQPQLITGERGMVIRPRVVKSREEQAGRVRGMAEVFTPAWVVRKMVDALDIAVDTRCLEITCGEAPFLTLRYDATTGDAIALADRAGLLDRKLRLIDGQQPDDNQWLAQVRLAFQTTYGYEWQGDSLLLARENLLFTFIDHYEARNGREPGVRLLKEFAEIISWNLWQMDGLSYCTPREKNAAQPTQQISLFADAPTEAPPPFCLINDWQKNQTIKVIEIKNNNTMKFDVIIGNPPYQQESIGANESDTPLYHYFYDESFKVGKIVELITPARFLFNAGGAPQLWNQKMLNDEHLKVLQYEQDSSKFFSNTDIKGGVAVIYRDTTKTFGAIKTFTSYPELNTILNKVWKKAQRSLTDVITNRGLYRYSDKVYEEQPQAMNKTADKRIAPSCFERMPDLFTTEKPNDNHEYIQILGLLGRNREYRWFRKDYVSPVKNLNLFKVIVPKANGSGAIGEVLSTPLIGTPLIGFTETYISIGATPSKEHAEATLKYVKSKFARTMLGILKVTQNNAKPTWAYVPLQDFSANSDIDWSKSIDEIDEQLFDKYGLDDKERDFIRTKVKEMK